MGLGKARRTLFRCFFDAVQEEDFRWFKAYCFFFAFFLQLKGFNTVAAQHCGLIHVAGPEPISRFAVAQLFCQWLGISDTSRIRGGLSAESGLNRPTNCSLNVDLAKKTLQTVFETVAPRIFGIKPSRSAS
eukprot:gnl/Hemi2/16026_TR5310_c0_g1_i1.p1 gnl/Hemi2/16026_TR5310_c0_g1~~gnl/Hemi2/16026_TR5310_c0_g1_i1.p1  ORF type:complete len:131 (+),score=34.74 gnl/Hemi2/16026_TR5310_c0_g1_i1:132-524(+)